MSRFFKEKMLTNNLVTSQTYRPSKRLHVASSIDFSQMRYRAKIKVTNLAFGPNSELIVTDCDQHRIFIFDVTGVFKFAFGGSGNEDGQLTYPVCASYCSYTQRIIVAERSPAHQLQAFSFCGQFLHKFGADRISNPRGIAIDKKGNIVLLESRVMRVTVFSIKGLVISSFTNADWKFPSCVAVDEKHQIFVSDNRTNLVYVLNYAGSALFKIDCSNLIAFPIAVCVSLSGSLLVAGNHEGLHLAEFNFSGVLLRRWHSENVQGACAGMTTQSANVLALNFKTSVVHFYNI